ncbi:hypothetical protein [Bacteroides sp. UBA939]|uniref:hypothetical protein n=1 Tax=Bacteroides sp. UBA939 TaxID=1946092 RepID=UPI0025B8F3AF|nr:hypothetical protein [Bacteroides sp. UBA939]
MNNQSDTPSITLESIVQRKLELREKLRAQQQVMADITREIFEPLEPAVNKGSAIMRAFNTGMAVFDGLMLGLKMMRKIRQSFRTKE